MTTTPTSKSKLSCKNVRGKSDIKQENDYSPADDATNTPTRKNQQSEEGDYSPIYFPLTQDYNEEIDVLWDWHSPQTSQRIRKKQKRLIPVQSPKFPLERHPSNKQSQNFERLQNELKALQEELAQPDDKSWLCISPQEEIKYKREEGNLDLEQEPNHCDEFNDLFNDSMDEQLISFSQQIENELLSQFEVKNEMKSTFSFGVDDSIAINKLIDKYTDKKRPESNNNKLTGSETMISTPKPSRTLLPRTLSDNPPKENVIQTMSGKLEFYRTRSFELATISGQSDAVKTTLEEIERKRLEAKAKLESKKKNNTAINKSPLKCSSEEIEKKRLQALAKLEAKRLQDIVEKKRQEALKKLRMKNASQVKSTLTQRL